MTIINHQDETLKAMDYNIEQKQKLIDRLIAENIELEGENKRLREEVVFLEHLRETSMI
jgi:regulator of replication initiation timing